MEQIAIVLSIFSTIVALISAYISQFKKGKIMVLPIRAYKLSPGNFSVDSQSYRKVELTLPLGFMNSGAVSHAVSDLRVRVTMDNNQELILGWLWEYPTLESAWEQKQFPAQPTLGPYASINRVYSFCNETIAEQGKLVMAMEAACGNDPKQIYPAVLEMRTCNHHWRPLRRFGIHHPGRNRFEEDFSRINMV